MDSKYRPEHAGVRAPLLDQKFDVITEVLWDAGCIFACPDTDSFPARCQNRE